MHFRGLPYLLPTIPLNLSIEIPSMRIILSALTEETSHSSEGLQLQLQKALHAFLEAILIFFL